MPIGFPAVFRRVVLRVAGCMSFLFVAWDLLRVVRDGYEGLRTVALAAGFFNDMYLLFLYIFAELTGALHGSPGLASAAYALVWVLLFYRFSLLASPPSLVVVAAFVAMAFLCVIHMLFLSEERLGFASPYRWIGRLIHGRRQRRREPMQAPI